jgi:hypothetical protein
MEKGKWFLLKSGDKNMIIVREDNLASLCELKVGDILAQNYNTRAVVIQADNKNKLWQYEIVGGSVVTLDKEDPLFKVPFTVIAHNSSIEEARKSNLINYNKDVVTLVKELNTENGHIKFTFNKRNLSFKEGKEIWDFIFEQSGNTWYERYGLDYNVRLEKFDRQVEMFYIERNQTYKRPNKIVQRIQELIK